MSRPLEFLDLVEREGEPPSRAPLGPESDERPTLVSCQGGVETRGPTGLVREQLHWEGIAVGSVIDGKYRVVGELGRGGMGVVVVAHDQHLDRNVAVKLIQKELATPSFRARFLEEARAMARVNHRNVVQIYASGEHGQVPYFVMELVPGETLGQWLERWKGSIDLAVAVRILTSVCEGVSAIHAADTLHRDIKPSNVLLDANLRPRITDLGVSTFCRAGHASRAEIVGTPAYMAPEVAFPMPGESATPRADVYSLGCVAYELITGELPFSAENDEERLVKHATFAVRPPSALRKDLPPGFDRALLRALAKDPNDRTPTAEAFRKDLFMALEEGSEPDRILVVEDDDDFRQVLAFSLGAEFADAEVVAVSNGRSAIEALREHPASVVILDFNLPDIDAREVTRSLRAMDTARHMPIVILTGWGGPAEWKQLLLLGADRFLTKPVSLDDLVTSVRHSLRDRLHVPGPLAANPPSALPAISPVTSSVKTPARTNPS